MLIKHTHGTQVYKLDSKQSKSQARRLRASKAQDAAMERIKKGWKL